MNLIRKKFEKNIFKEIEIFQPDVVMTMPHLVINVQTVLKIHQKNSFPLVIVPLLHEQDANWPFESMKSALSQVDAVIGVTNHECERLKDFYEVPDQKLFYAPLGVDMIPITNKKPRKNQILFLGRKIFKKGIPLLLDAMNLVWEKIPDVDLVLAGTRNEQTQEIDNIITKINSDRKNKIISVDDISEIKKSQLLSESICLVFPSEIESFGLVILESWVHFTPVVTLDLPVFRSIVNHKFDGLLTNPRDPISLSEAIIFMLENPEIAHNMGEIGRYKVEKVFNWQKVTEGYLKSYEYAIAEYNK